MKLLFDQISHQCSELTTKRYSTSFSLGIRFLNRSLHKPVYAIYGFVRFADEIVDSFHGYDKEYLLQKFKNDTHEAISQRISLNPILNAFQETVHRYNIEDELVNTFLKSMEMDLTQTTHTRAGYETYILGSAEVVGLMCLRVFTNGNEAYYQQLKPAAMRLGAAFQKVNFLRDVQSDFEVLGRSYFPGVDLANFSLRDKQKIESEIEEDFMHAIGGIKQLPETSRKGVYLAYIYYRKLFVKIKRIPPERIMKERVRLPNGRKMTLLVNTMVRHQFKLL